MAVQHTDVGRFVESIAIETSLSCTLQFNHTVRRTFRCFRATMSCDDANGVTHLHVWR